MHKINCLELFQRSVPKLVSQTAFFVAHGFDSGSAGTYHARAMGNPLRDRRTPSELAECGQVIEIERKIKDFPQLAAIVQADLAALDPDRLPAGWRNAPVSGRLEFGFGDAQNRLPVLDGRVAVTFDAVCQRCLGPFRCSLDVPLRLMFGVAAMSSDVAGNYELWDLAGDTLRPLDVVDESLVMALPLVAMHQNDPSCIAPEGGAAEPADVKIRPFAALRSQMDTDD